MKTVTVTKLPRDFGSVMKWIAEGEELEIVKRGKVIALLSPPRPQNKVNTVRLPDFAARKQRIFGDRVLPGNIVAEERESYEW